MIKRICRAMIHPQHEHVPQHETLSFLLIGQYQGKRVKSPDNPEVSPATRSNTGAWDWAALRAPAMAYDLPSGGYFDDTAIPLRFSMYRVPE